MVDKPLYCFKFDDITGQIMQYKIDDYDCTVDGYHKHMTYVFFASFGRSITKYKIKSEKLDHFVYNSLYSFNPDSERAKRIIRETLSEKANAAKREEKRCLSLINLLDKFN